MSTVDGEGRPGHWLGTAGGVGAEGGGADEDEEEEDEEDEDEEDEDEDEDDDEDDDEDEDEDEDDDEDDDEDVTINDGRAENAPIFTPPLSPAVLLFPLGANNLLLLPW